MQVLEKILGEIKAFKRKVVSENQDYQKGYLCALSYVEGVIAEHMNDGKGRDKLDEPKPVKNTQQELEDFWRDK